MNHTTRTIFTVALFFVGFLLFQIGSSSEEGNTQVKTSFIPPNARDIELDYEHVAAMGEVSKLTVDEQSPDRQVLAKYMSPPFLRYMGYFLKPEFLPKPSYVESNLTFAENVPISTHEGPDRVAYNADVTYLQFRLDDRDVLISQFGVNKGKIGVSFSISQATALNATDSEAIKSAVTMLIDRYFIQDQQAPFELDVRASATVNAALISGGKNMRRETANYRNTLRGIYSTNGVCLVFQKHPWYTSPDDPDTKMGGPPLPKGSRPHDKYFDRLLEYKPPE